MCRAAALGWLMPQFCESRQSNFGIRASQSSALQIDWRNHVVLLALINSLGRHGLIQRYSQLLIQLSATSLVSLQDVRHA